MGGIFLVLRRKRIHQIGNRLPNLFLTGIRKERYKLILLIQQSFTALAEIEDFRSTPTGKRKISMKGNISRRKFVTGTISVAAASSLGAYSAASKVGFSGELVAQTSVALTEAPGWKDQ